MVVPKPKAVFVCEDLPLKNDSGYCTYNNAVLDALISLEYDVLLVVTGPRLPILLNSIGLRVNDGKYRILARHGLYVHNSIFPTSVSSLSRSIKRVISRIRPAENSYKRITGPRTVKIGRFLSDKECRWVASAIGEFKPDVVVVDTIMRAQFLTHLNYKCVKVLIAHDIFTERCENLARRDLMPDPIVDLRAEIEIVGRFDSVAAITDSDSLWFKNNGYSGRVRTLLAPVVPSKVSTEKASFETRSRALYIGSSAPHNVDGFIWFMSEVWPLVRKCNPDAQVDVVGTICNQLPGGVAGVNLVGRVDELDVVSSQARIAINPVLAGSGMKIKLLDYFAQGLGCITTEVGAQGFPLSPLSPIVCCQDSRSFAEQLLKTLSNVEAAFELSKRAVEYRSLFSKKSFEETLWDLIKISTDASNA